MQGTRAFFRARENFDQKVLISQNPSVYSLPRRDLGYFSEKFDSIQGYPPFESALSRLGAQFELWASLPQTHESGFRAECLLLAPRLADHLH